MVKRGLRPLYNKSTNELFSTVAQQVDFGLRPGFLCSLGYRNQGVLKGYGGAPTYKETRAIGLVMMTLKASTAANLVAAGNNEHLKSVW